MNEIYTELNSKTKSELLQELKEVNDYLDKNNCTQIKVNSRTTKEDLIQLVGTHKLMQSSGAESLKHVHFEDIQVTTTLDKIEINPSIQEI